MRIVKKLRLLGLCMVLGFGFSACGSSEKAEEVKTPEFVYTPEYKDMPEGVNSYNAKMSGGKIYYTKGSFDEATQIYTENFYYMDLATGEEVQIPFQKKENETVTSFSVAEDGSLYILGNSFTYEEESGNSTNSFKLTKCTTDGTVVYEIDLSELLAGEENSYIQNMQIDKDGNIYLTNGDSKIWLLNKDGVKTGIIQVDNYINTMGVTKEGTVIVTMYGTEGIEVKEVDFAGKAFGQPITGLASGNGNMMIAPGLEQGLLVSNGSTLLSYDMVSKTSTEILQWINSDINYNNIRAFSALSEDQIAVVTERYSQDASKSEIIILTKKPYDSVTEKTILTYGTLYSDDKVIEKIIDFNKTNEKYRIEVKEYGIDDWEQAQVQMNADILSGNGPDIFSLSYGASIDSYINKGVFEDLNQYLEKDTLIKKEDYLENVLNAYAVEDKLYAIMPSFTIGTIMGKTSLIGDRESWTIQELIAFAKEQPEGTKIFEYATKDSILSTLLMYNIEEYIDYKTGECSFDSESFIQILEFANQFDKEFVWNENAPSTPSLIAENKLTLVNTNFSDVLSFQAYQKMFGEDVTFIGYPTSEGKGSVLESNGSTLAINAKAKNKEGAWEFVRMFMLEDYQTSLDWGFPILKSALEDNFQESMKEESWTDETGTEVVQPKTTWGWNDFEVEIYAATQEEVDEIRDLIMSIDKVSSYDQQIQSIVAEEAAAYFEGMKTAPEVATIIQSRIQIYVNESR